MDLFTLVSLIIFIPTNVVLSLVILHNNHRSWTNRLFATLISIFTLYLVVNSLPYLPLENELRLLFSRAIMATALFINVFVFFFLKTFPFSQLGVPKRLAAILFAGTAFFALFTLVTPIIFENITVSGSNVVTPTPGMLMPVFLLHTLALLGWGLVSVILNYKKSRGNEREKIGYILSSFFLLFLLIIIFNFVLTVFFQIADFVPLLPIYLLIFNSIVGFAIIKKKLLEIRMLVARSVAYFLLIVIAAALYGSILFLIGQYFGRVDLDMRSLLISISLAIVLALSFQSLKQFITKITDFFFYKNKYDTDAFLYRLTVLMASTLHLEDLARHLLMEIKKTMKVKFAALILVEDGKVYQVMTEGDVNIPTIDENEFKLISETGSLLIYDDLNEGKLKKILRKYQFQLVSNIKHEGNQSGFLALGEKLSGETYLTQDTTVISIFSSEAAVAIENAKAYEEIRRFNITLSEEVERATKKLVSANHKLQQLDKLKDEFVSIASHELRTPMVSIKNYLWMALAGKGGKLTDKQEFYLQRAYDSSNRMTKLINDMLNISRIESGRILLHVTELNLPELIDRIIDENQARAKQVGVKLHREKTTRRRGSEKETQLSTVLADQDKVAEVLVNLIGNALKFTPKEGTVSVRVEADDEYAYVSVIDDGVGLEKEQIPKLFKKFGMVKDSYRSYAEAAQGSGLGLYVSKSIIELHEGDIWVTSEGRDKGSTFCFTLHLYSEQDAKRINKRFEQGKDAGLIASVHTNGDS